jgi:hypothetical protein
MDDAMETDAQEPRGTKRTASEADFPSNQTRRIRVHKRFSSIQSLKGEYLLVTYVGFGSRCRQQNRRRRDHRRSDACAERAH